MAETTQVKISEIKVLSLEDLKRPQPPVFTLQEQEARDFAHSILIKRHESFSIIVSKEYNCEFYKGPKLLVTLRFIKRNNGMLLTWRESPNSGFIILYPHSSRRIERFFEEHNVAIAAK